MASEASGNNGDLSVASCKLQVAPAAATATLAPQSTKGESSGNDVHTTSAIAAPTSEDSVDSLRKELDRLKLRLEEERKKLNDISCALLTILSFLAPISPVLFLYLFQFQPQIISTASSPST